MVRPAGNPAIAKTRLAAFAPEWAAHLRAIRRWAIMNAVIAVIARKGLNDLTVQEVAAEVGVGKGSIYLYFSSREEMLAATAQYARRRLAREFTSAFSDGTLQQRLLNLIDWESRQNEEYRGLVIAAGMTAADGLADNASSEWGWNWHQAGLLRIFEEARARNEIRDIDTAPLARFFADYLEGLTARTVGTGTAPPDEAERETILSFMLHGIAPATLS